MMDLKILAMFFLTVRVYSPSRDQSWFGCWFCSRCLGDDVEEESIIPHESSIELTFTPRKRIIGRSSAPAIFTPEHDHLLPDCAATSSAALDQISPRESSSGEPENEPVCSKGGPETEPVCSKEPASQEIVDARGNTMGRGGKHSSIILEVKDNNGGKSKYVILEPNYGKIDSKLVDELEFKENKRIALQVTLHGSKAAHVGKPIKKTWKLKNPLQVSSLSFPPGYMGKFDPITNNCGHFALKTSRQLIDPEDWEMAEMYLKGCIFHDDTLVKDIVNMRKFRRWKILLHTLQFLFRCSYCKKLLRKYAKVNTPAYDDLAALQAVSEYSIETLYVCQREFRHESANYWATGSKPGDYENDYNRRKRKMNGCITDESDESDESTMPNH